MLAVTHEDTFPLPQTVCNWAVLESFITTLCAWIRSGVFFLLQTDITEIRTKSYSGILQRSDCTGGSPTKWASSLSSDHHLGCLVALQHTLVLLASPQQSGLVRLLHISHWFVMMHGGRILLHAWGELG